MCRENIYIHSQQRNFLYNFNDILNANQNTIYCTLHSIIMAVYLYTFSQIDS